MYEVVVLVMEKEDIIINILIKIKKYGKHKLQHKEKKCNLILLK